jgi:hypothetical protein
MSFVIEAQMDAIKRMSNEKRASTEDEIDYITEKLERFSRQMTPDQYEDWCHMLKFRQMQLALDDLASVTLAEKQTVDTKKMMDDALEAIRLYHASCKRRWVQQIPVKRPDSPYVRTEIFIPCESCQPANDTGGAMLATLMRPGEEHVSIPMIVHPQEHRCYGEMVYNWRGSYFRCDDDEDPDCPQYKPAIPVKPADEEDLYA